MRAALYVRYSSASQQAAEAQYRRCLARAEREGWEIVQTFAEQTVGGSGAARPRLHALLAAAAGGDFDVLVFDAQSRISREPTEAERVFRRLEAYGVRIVAVDKL